MKRTIGVVFLLVIIALGIYLFVRYQNSQKEEHGTFLLPRLEYSAFVVKQIDPGFVKMDMQMLIDNPSPIGFKLDSFSYNLYIADYRVFGSTYPDEIDFNNFDSSYIMLPVTMYNDSLTFILDSLKDAGVEETTYRVKGKFYTDVPVVDKQEFEYDQSFEAPVYKIPEGRLVDWEFTGIEDGKAGIDFTLLVINLNTFPYEFKDMEYRVTLGENNRVFEGYKPGRIDIPEEDSATIVLPVQVNLSDLGGAFLEYIGKGDDLKYEFYSKMKLAAENNSIEDSPVEIFANGDLESIQEFVSSTKKATD